MVNKKQWLPHLDKSIPMEAYGYPVSMYSIALEGWRRGLTLKFINNNKKAKATIDYSLTYKEKEIRFVGTRAETVSKKAINICMHKNKAKDYLEKAGVSIPKGETFSIGAPDDNIIAYANSLGYPLVLKPSNASGGKGVIANIKDESEFKDALLYVKYDLKYSDLIVEEFFEGEDYRIYVIGNEVIGAIHRVPANVIGDGVNTIKKLIKLKFLERNTNPGLFNRPIKVDKEMNDILHSKGFTINSVPTGGERVLLKTKNNISAGGDSIDVTEELTEEIKENAINAVKAIPGLIQGGVDVLFDKQRNQGVVIEVNSQPSIRTHLFPMEGLARDIPKKIIDYYFPETIKSKNHSQPLFYFDIKTVFDSFQAGLVKEITIPDMPKGELTITRFRITGTLRGVNYERWVQRRARALNLNGYIMHLKNRETSIVVSGLVEAIDEFRNIINNTSPKKANIASVIEKSRKWPIKLGFEIL